jgi:hypothetical protein
MVMSSQRQRVRKHLSADALIQCVRHSFEQVPDSPPPNTTIPLADALMSGFALFSLKDPSLLLFDQRRTNDKDNLRTVYHINRVPCDTQMRVRLDPVEPQHLAPPFTDVFRQLQRGKALEPFVYHLGSYLLSVDGTETFSSQKIHCPSCMQRHNQKGEITYYHQMVNAVIVHPDVKEVIPLRPEPIQKQDGAVKNDCERNAAKRLFAQIHRDHPHLSFIVTEDGLSSNAPHIREILSYGWHYILVAKPKDHKPLFARMEEAFRAGQASVLTVVDEDGVIHHYRWLSQVPLNDSHPDLLVNFLEYWEVSATGVKYYNSWVTDMALVPVTVGLVARGGRARWKVENETHNTLKNQGYQYEHNFGHGEKNLAVVFPLLMILAFLVDQTQQLCCGLFRRAWKKVGTKRALWAALRMLFGAFVLRSMRQVLEMIAYGYEKATPAVDNSS